MSNRLDRPSTTPGLDAELRIGPDVLRISGPRPKKGDPTLMLDVYQTGRGTRRVDPAEVASFVAEIAEELVTGGYSTNKGALAELERSSASLRAARATELAEAAAKRHGAPKRAVAGLDHAE